MTEPHTLTDRYVTATLRSLPQRQRADIDAELRALIADGIEDRLEAGATTESAEREVLIGLGEPRRLAAGYADRSLSLIGPAYFLDYLRFLTVLVSTIPLVWFLVMGVTTFASGETALVSFVAALWGAIETAMYIAFFTTVVFAIVERTSSRRASSSAVWDPAALPDVPDRRSYRRGLVFGVVMAVVVTSAVVLLQTFATTDGHPPLQPALWDSGVLYVALFFAAVNLAIHVFTFYTGWTFMNAVVSLALNLLFAVPAVWIASSGRLLNPEYFAAIGWPEGEQVVTTTVVVVVIVLAVLDVLDGLGRAGRPS